MQIIKDKMTMDVLFINPGSSKKVYQGLSKDYSAIEPPTWSLLLAQSCRSVGYDVGILDCCAENLSYEDTVSRIKEFNPRLLCFVVYGQNVNAGTTSMTGATSLSNYIKENNITTPIAYIGSHVQALPYEALNKEKSIDIIFTNEGVYALRNLLKEEIDLENLSHIKGIGFRKNGKAFLTLSERLVPQDRMDEDLPGYAWDLLPYKIKPLDLYRSHFWHADFNHEKRTPFVAIYTSLGCQFSCSFCMINIVNRVDNSDHINAAHSKGMRFWSVGWVQKEFEKLARMGVETVRISDEMFFLNKKYYRPILQTIIDNEYNFNMWTYSRIDTVRSDALDLFKRAGVGWLALGVEAGNQTVRKEVSKGSFKDVNIRDVCKEIGDHDINIISNFIFRLPEDSFENMKETLDLAIDLNTETTNFYPCQALPGSPLYTQAKLNGIELPTSFSEFAFLSYDSKPLPTKFLSSAEVVSFRDNAWDKYFTNTRYLDLVEKKFGAKEKKNVIEMSKIKLKRKLLGD